MRAPPRHNEAQNKTIKDSTEHIRQTYPMSHHLIMQYIKSTLIPFTLNKGLLYGN